MNNHSNTLTNLADELQTIWHRDIPLSAAMDLVIESYDGDKLAVAASLAPNVNVHGTAFAGSLYAIAALCGWGSMHLQLKLRNIEGSIVIASGAIDYDKPVKEDIRASCTFGDHDDAWAKLAERGKGRFPLTASVVAGGGEAATFRGEYAVLIR